MLLLTSLCAKALGFSREERITAMFCGSKKSLASGAPTAKIMFAGHPGLGMIMLPLLLYHQIQLVVCTILAGSCARDNTARAE
jgi:sodium/bile acid cotransporter 7